jgi:1-acyl-sn-glycerol-3-phosphate acyltransferase
MFLISFYLFALGYAGLFLWLFPVPWLALGDPLWWLLLVVSAILGLVFSFLTQLAILWIVGKLRDKKPMTDPFNHRFANSLLRLGLHLIRTKVIVTGRENIPEGNFVLVGNHQENYDILVLKPIFRNHPLSFIAKEALAKMPIFGPWMRRLGNVFISRDADRSAARSIIDGIKHVKQGMSMGIFPEGKRSFGNEMKSQADLLVVTQYDTCTIFKRFPWRRYRVYVHVHELMPYDSYKDLSSHELSDLVKDKIQTQLDTFARTIG